MLGPLAPLGRDRIDLGSLGRASFGRALSISLPEDIYDQQPLSGSAGPILLCADVRIDNREELAGSLGIAAARLARMSDAQMLLCAWEKWQIGCFDQILGDVAMANWDSSKGRLTLARTASSLKPLFYHQGAGFIAFASMPEAIFALPQVAKRLDIEEVAAVVGGLPGLGSATMFEGIRSVLHGHAVELSGRAEVVVRHWFPEKIVPGSFPGTDPAGAMRAELDRAVVAQLRRSKGAIVSQLSSGRDSSAVTTSAAIEQHRRGEELIVLTGAPHIGSTARTSPHHVADESELATLTASAYPNIRHSICRPSPGDVARDLRDATRHHFMPLLGLGGLHWTTRVAEEATASGATVMLIGSTGNFSISAGGVGHLVDLLTTDGLRPWWQEARRFGGWSLAAWRNVASVSLGPFMPKALYHAARRISGRDQPASYQVPTLRQPFRQRSEAIIADYYADRRPPKSYYEFRHMMLTGRDNAEKLTEARAGLDVRDPTADRRLIELCLSFPPDALVSGRTERPAYEDAFRDRLPPEVLYSKKRGRQGADWFELFPKEEVSRLFAHFKKNRNVAEFFDFDYIQRQIALWPEAGSRESVSQVHYQNHILGALGVADFIDFHFPD
ncbi:MAG: asparagine synthase-related protein [Sphingomicrobium sp.]